MAITPNQEMQFVIKGSSVKDGTSMNIASITGVNEKADCTDTDGSGFGGTDGAKVNALALAICELTKATFDKANLVGTLSEATLQ